MRYPTWSDKHSNSFSECAPSLFCLSVGLLAASGWASRLPTEMSLTVASEASVRIMTTHGDPIKAACLNNIRFSGTWLVDRHVDVGSLDTECWGRVTAGERKGEYLALGIQLCSLRFYSRRFVVDDTLMILQFGRCRHAMIEFVRFRLSINRRSCALGIKSYSNFPTKADNTPMLNKRRSKPVSLHNPYSFTDQPFPIVLRLIRPTQQSHLRRTPSNQVILWEVHLPSISRSFRLCIFTRTPGPDTASIPSGSPPPQDKAHSSLGAFPFNPRQTDHTEQNLTTAGSPCSRSQDHFGIYKMPSSGTNPSSAKPPGWTPAMAVFIQKLLRNGEDTKSAIILLETEWPSMEGKVGLGWVEGLRK